MKKTLFLATALSLTVNVAFAQTTNSTVVPASVVNYWVDFVWTVAGLCTSGFFTYLGVVLPKLFNLQKGSTASTILTDVITMGQQEVAAKLASAPPEASAVDVKNTTIEKFIEGLSSSAQDAMKFKNMTPESLAAKINGGLAIASAQSSTVAKNTTVSVVPNVSEIVKTS